FLLFFYFSFFFFFFQAEDGIRDGHVTGVQTCALPISKSDKPTELPQHCHAGEPALELQACGGNAYRRHCENPASSRIVPKSGNRSEERRVGKECRSRWTTYQ